MIGAVDAHCHLSDERIFHQRKMIIESCAGRGVHWFVLGGVDPKEWSRQLILKQEFPHRIVCSFGLHPYFVSTADLPALDEALVELKKLSSAHSLMGEMGLDFRPHIAKERPQIQERYFGMQLDLARELKKPAVLHVVRAHEPALKMLRHKPVSGMVHAFNSSWEIAKKYLDLGLYLSLGGHSLRPEHEHLLKAIPLDRMLLESDAPDQAPPGQNEHSPATVLLLGERVAANKGLTPEAVMETTRRNMEKLLGVTLTL